ncbi:MAG: acyl--CoA ligase [Burkholderiaceae bacterium]|nr:acyl--CoA ligase [Burkholderiaceae bacterium]
MTAPLNDLLKRPFGTVPDMIAHAARVRPDHPALIMDDARVSFQELNAMADRVAASLQRDGIAPGDAVAICAETSIRYVAVFIGALRAGGLVTPLPPSASPRNLSAMLENSEAKWIFLDQASEKHWIREDPRAQTLQRISLDNADGGRAWAAWLDTVTEPVPVDTQPDWPFNLIYSSGTTGMPKGIVQPCSMRWSHTQRAHLNGYGPDAVLLVATPLYSNTTLVALLPALALGATVVMMGKFDTLRYLELAQQHRVTHTILVPVQYQRLMDDPAFDHFDLSSFQAKFSTSAPFGASLMAEVQRRWPGKLTEIYGMTEGGGRCELEAHRYPDKLHTVGRPASGHDIRLIDESGCEVAPGETGEVVGSSSAMMRGYHRLPEKTREVEWFDANGKRFIRTGDIGRFDEDGFLILSDRMKDMVISGGFNIYPSDIEAELAMHPDVRESAVIGVPSRRWGETPAAFVVLKPGAGVNAESLLEWVNGRLGKMQRLTTLELVDALPRSEIGKVLKRELRAIHAPRDDSST